MNSTLISISNSRFLISPADGLANLNASLSRTREHLLHSQRLSENSYADNFFFYPNGELFAGIEVTGYENALSDSLLQLDLNSQQLHRFDLSNVVQDGENWENLTKNFDECRKKLIENGVRNPEFWRFSRLSRVDSEDQVVINLFLDFF